MVIHLLTCVDSGYRAVTIPPWLSSHELLCLLSWGRQQGGGAQPEHHQRMPCVKHIMTIRPFNQFDRWFPTWVNQVVSHGFWKWFFFLSFVQEINVIQRKLAQGGKQECQGEWKNCKVKQDLQGFAEILLNPSLEGLFNELWIYKCSSY